MQHGNLAVVRIFILQFSVNGILWVKAYRNKNVSKIMPLCASMCEIRQSLRPGRNNTQQISVRRSTCVSTEFSERNACEQWCQSANQGRVSREDNTPLEYCVRLRSKSPEITENNSITFRRSLVERKIRLIRNWIEITLVSKFALEFALDFSGTAARPQWVKQE